MVKPAEQLLVLHLYVIHLTPADPGVSCDVREVELGLHWLLGAVVKVGKLEDWQRPWRQWPLATLVAK